MYLACVSQTVGTWSDLTKFLFRGSSFVLGPLRMPEVSATLLGFAAMTDKMTLLLKMKTMTASNAGRPPDLPDSSGSP